jgi:hypothetical protein
MLVTVTRRQGDTATLATAAEMHARFDVLEKIVKIRKLVTRSACLVVVGMAVGLLLSGCATPSPNGPDGCVGPPDFCQPYFGN